MCMKINRKTALNSQHQEARGCFYLDVMLSYLKAFPGASLARTGLSVSVKWTRGRGVPGPACALHADRSSRTLTGAGVTHVVPVWWSEELNQ